MSDTEAKAIEELRWIAEYDLAESIVALPWIADSVSDTEVRDIITLRSIADRSTADLAKSVIALPWVADDVSDIERSAIHWLFNIAAKSAATAESVIALPWVADEVSDAEADSLESLYEVTYSSADLAKSVIALPWVADGVSDIERSVISSLSFIASTDLAESVIALPWLADGVSDNERGVIHSLRFIASTDLAKSVIALPWLADGVSDNERGAVVYLRRMDADAAARLMNMPFLQTPEAADVAALRSLQGLTEDQLADMLSRPMLKDGITDDEAPIVSMLYRTLEYAPDRVDSLLDPGRNTVERRTVELPLAGEVELAIVRTYLGVKRSMDLLENAVREAENLMDEPLPTRYVGLLYENAISHTKFDGMNFGIHMVIRPEYDVDGGSGSPRIIAHEVAHYYWRGNADWLDEGMADLMELAVENRRVGTLVDVTRPPCEFARTIKKLEELAPEQGEDAFICNYSLGEGLFVSLLRTLGEDAFWEGARRLYAASPAGIDEVYQAFGPEASGVIKRWYEGK